MDLKESFLKNHGTYSLLGTVLLVITGGCVGYVDGPRTQVYAEPPPMEATVVVQDDYVYYPGYDVYYSSNRHQYLWLEGRAWVTRPQPRGVSVDVLFASPSVRMDFHDSPARHHADVVRTYPRNWAPPGANHGQKEDRKDDKGGGRGGK